MQLNLLSLLNLSSTLPQIYDGNDIAFYESNICKMKEGNCSTRVLINRRYRDLCTTYPPTSLKCGKTIYHKSPLAGKMDYFQADNAVRIQIGHKARKN